MASGRAVHVAVLAMAAVAVGAGRTLQTVEDVKKTEPKPMKEEVKPMKEEVKPVKEEKKEKSHHKDITYGKLNTTEQMCVDKVMGWYHVKTLHPWDQCGGAGEAQAPIIIIKCHPSLFPIQSAVQYVTEDFCDMRHVV